MMLIPFDVWLQVRQEKDLDTELAWWNISKSNTTSALWVEITAEQKDVK